MEYINNPYFLLALTFIVYALAQIIQVRSHSSLFNPILITIAIIIIFLLANDIPFETYRQSGVYIDFWLKPAVVALGVPLYKQLSSIRKQLLPILLSLAAKSVTTPIAMEVTETLGGIPSLTAAVVVAVGIIGGMTGFSVMHITHVNSPIAQGLSLGAAAHAVGTSRAITVSDRYGAFASLGLTLNGIFTAMLTPWLLRMLGYF